jgi:TonB family protein
LASPAPAPDLTPDPTRRDPVALATYAPNYPEQENCEGIGGHASVLLTYDDEGVITDIQIAKTTGNRNLDRSATTTARSWLIAPGTRHDRPVAGQATVSVNFEPEPSSSICKSPVRIESLLLGRKVQEDGQDRLQRTAVFAPGDTMLLNVAYSSTAGADKKIPITVVWLYQPPVPQSVGLALQTINSGAPSDSTATLIRTDTANAIASGENEIGFDISRTEGWQPGDYLVHVLVDDRERATFHYQVRAAKAEPAQP